MFELLSSMANGLSVFVLFGASVVLLMLPWIVAGYRVSKRVVWIAALCLLIPFIPYLGWRWVANRIVERVSTWEIWFYIDLAFTSKVVAFGILILPCILGWVVCLVWALKSESCISRTRSAIVAPTANTTSSIRQNSYTFATLSMVLIGLGIFMLPIWFISIPLFAIALAIVNRVPRFLWE